MKFVGIAGKNGFGVFDNDKRLANSEDYLIRNTSKTFDTFWEAFCFARDIYNDLQDEFDNVFFGSSKDIKINWILFRNKIHEMNTEP